ncbi:MAG: hypothetical protein SFV23_08060 [Planctomycetaceae bacterium]|nr:hypothetical protein [Planctomycetaceae bacterium]
MERRPLSSRVNVVPNADPEAVRRFVTGEPPAAQPIPIPDSAPPATEDRTPSPVTLATPRRRAKAAGVLPVGLIPVTVRLRAEIAGALKRASLERQLGGEAVFTQQELVEAALEPWLRRHGYLD